MYYTSEKTATELHEFLKTNAYFAKFIWYHSYYEVQYAIPANFTKLDTPQWAHIRSIEKTAEGYDVVIGIFEDEAFIKQYALQYPALKVVEGQP